MKNLRITISAFLTWLFGVAVLIGLSGCGQEPEATASPQPPRFRSSFDDEIVWYANYQAAIREAKITGKPIFLEFRCVP